MNWRPLFILPLAALCVGDPASVPLLNPRVPENITANCGYEGIRKTFLSAYAYRQEKPEVGRFLCERVRSQLPSCGPAAAELQQRAEALCNIPLSQ